MSRYGSNAVRSFSLACLLLSFLISFCFAPLGIPRNTDAALELLLFLANNDNNYDKAHYTLGSWYEYGFGDVEQNVHKAYQHYEKAAEQGHVKALEKVRWQREKGRSPVYWARFGTGVVLTAVSVAVLMARNL